ncbi:putative metal-dependent phosphohydrolase [Blattamonas nauphoetae]|uniref:5'-deoxynucleotidase n=1 Tax=Blattamonas nauphoetae TaxID=2049346 RepID=A0ABQ9YHE3_9EUKA|nr:putative metal-dependent phosphohydrolase [Blattamonas nauphoetae]
MDQSHLLHFLHTISQLKNLPRTGWVGRVQNPETVSSHIFRTALLPLVLNEPTLDVNKCVKMGLLHDLAESLIGDLTPDQAATVNKHELEKQGFQQLVSDLPDPISKDFLDLWLEFEEGTTPEARFMKEIDKLEMVLQAREYETDQPGVNLEPFFTSTEGIFTYPSIQALDSEARKQRPRHEE